MAAILSNLHNLPVFYLTKDILYENTIKSEPVAQGQLFTWQ